MERDDTVGGNIQDVSSQWVEQVHTELQPCEQQGLVGHRNG